MESRADVYGVGLLEKGRNFIRQTGDTLQRAAAALLGMLLSNVALPGEVSPFGAAFAIAAPPSLRIASIVGAVLGYIFYFAGKAGGFLVGGLSGIAWQGLGGLVLALGIERTASAVSDRRYAQAVKWSGIFLAGALPPLAAGLLDRLSVGGLILCLCQGCLMAGACWLFHRAFRWVELSLTRPTAAPRDRPESADVASVLLTAGLLSGALSRLCVGRISVGRVLALTVILLFGCRKSGGSGLGAAAGVTAGILAALCGPQRGMASISGEALPGIWGIGGLLAGLFAPLGRGFCCAAMLLGETASIFLLARDESTYILLAESLAAGVLFLLVPPRAVILTERWLGGEPPESGKKAVGELCSPACKPRAPRWRTLRRPPRLFPSGCWNGTWPVPALLTASTAAPLNRFAAAAPMEWSAGRRIIPTRFPASGGSISCCGKRTERRRQRRSPPALPRGVSSRTSWRFRQSGISGRIWRKEKKSGPQPV